MEKLTILLLCSVILISILVTCEGVDTISVNETIKDVDNNTIVSAGGNFELGFFSPEGRSTHRYLGIWYKNISIRTVVWVANKETPLINDTSGVLKVGEGALKILNTNNSVIWSSNSSGSNRASDLVARLLDTGNLELRDQGRLIWQSFDYPGDTLLSGMRIGVDLKTGKEIHLTSWKSDDDPSAGQYVFGVDPNGYPQLKLFDTNGVVRVWRRFGPWNGVGFNGMTNLGENSIFTHEFVFNKDNIYYDYTHLNNLPVSRMQLSADGKIDHWNWINRTQSWTIYSTADMDNCASYGICGPYGICNINNVPPCSCLEGFEPRHPRDWNFSDWSSGCQRKKPLACGNGDVFLQLSGVKFPDTNHSQYNLSMSLSDCEAACKRDCSCTAFATLDIRRGGSGCLLWFDELMDIRFHAETQEIHIRTAASQLTNSPTAPVYDSSKKKRTIIIVAASSLGLVLVCLILALMYARWRKKQKSPMTGLVQAHEEKYANESRDIDKNLSSFSMSLIAKSTNNFSINNKLGEGGFGPVYKGVLEDGGEIAVKRLSATSRQGLDEFKNEVGCIAKLQHRNLVKLLGYCIQGDEKMLIYEYMANKSLDLFLFDKSGYCMLNWPLRFGIIHGIARGLLYLHQDSRLRIIHRDLKAGNILLDKDMNPKISDFGLARMFSGYETEANTNKVVGTHGYISPEYAVHGIFSIKSDVFSFGVLVMEIVSGRKNRGFSQEEHNDTLIGYAWRLHKEGRSLELVSSSLRHSCVDSQVLRVVHIGLLCVQHHAEDRPTMSSVVLMLGNENPLPPPKQPAFFRKEKFPGLNSYSSGPTLDSIDETTITVLNAR